jgi:hypothetical protein
VSSGAGRSTAAISALYTGLSLTLLATAAPYVDRAAGNVLADHIRRGYPTYANHRVDAAVTTWLVILTVIGVVGVAGWVGAIWAVTSQRSWARWLVTGEFVVGTLTALLALLTKDTSGEVGLAPTLGWIGMLPSSAGLAAVWFLWSGGADAEPKRSTPSHEEAAS